VVVAEVPWARHDARFTRDFEDQTAWLAVHVSKSTLAELMRVTWRTVGNVIGRVVKEREGDEDRLEGLTKIGIDEVSFRKGHRYLTVVVNHESGRVVWCAEGRDEATLERFFALVGPERSKRIEIVSADAASWIHNVVKRRCPNATICLDTFHVVSWATEALDVVRRQVWNAARRAGQDTQAQALKGARYALWKNRPDLTIRQRAKLADIARTNKPLFRAYLLKEQLRLIFTRPLKIALELLDDWLKWARRSRLRPFIKLARTITTHRTAIEETLRHGITNARVEALNNRIRLLTRIAFGFHSAQPLIAMVMLALGGLCPPLPGRL
jgi:transposase